MNNAHPLPERRFGATLSSDASTHFSLWAPDAKEVSVDLDDAGQSIPMASAGDGWFEAEVACGAGTRYRFRIDAGLRVPDPASRLQDGDVHDASVVTDPRAYRWKCTQWKGRPWHETVLYELHAGALGGYAGVRRELPRLARLGVTAVELMPIADFPGERNWGYDGVLPYAPDRAYGTPDELKALIDEAHELGLMVFLDVVYNHFGPDGNYLHAYASAFFRDDKQTPWGPAIDFRRPEVRAFFTGNALYWLEEFRFDGLRFDAVHAITSPDWLDEMAAQVRRRIADRHVHLVLEHDGNAASHLERGFDAQWNDDGHHVLHHLIAGEGDGYYADYASDPTRDLARFLAEGFVYQGQPSAHRGGEPRGEPSGHLPPSRFVLFLQNHDQIGNRALGERLLTLARQNNAEGLLRAGTALLLLSPQIPLIFMGEERGLDTPFLYFTSHEPELAEAVREGRRKEFAQFPAFADEKVRAAIPDPNAPRTFEDSIPDLAGEEGGDGWPAYFEALLALRRDVLMPRLEGAMAIGADVLADRAVAARWRLRDGGVLALYVNFSGDLAPLGELPAGELLFESVGGAGATLAAGHLPAACAVCRIEEQRR